MARILIQSMMKFSFIICFALLLSCGGASENAGEGNGGEVAKAAENVTDKRDDLSLSSVPVAITVADTGSISSYIMLSSTIETERTVDVYPLLMGVVRQLLVEEGDTVYRGQTLCVLVDDEYRLAAEKAEVVYEKRKLEFERQKQMLEKNLISTEAFENARFAMQEAAIDYDQAKVNLEHTRVKAPIAGVIAKRNVRLGDRIQTGTNLFTIVNMRDKQVKVHVPEKNVWQLEKGQQAIISSEFLTDTQYAGKIERIAPVVDKETGTVTVTIMMNENYPNLRPGMFVNVLIVTDTRDGTILVPKDAIVYENGLPYVFVVHDSLAYRKLLQIGFTNPDFVEAVGGVLQNDSLIVVGQSGLRDGAKVRIAPRDIPIQKNS